LSEFGYSVMERGRWLEVLGGEAGCLHLAQQFYGRVATNEVLKPLFPGNSFRCASEELSAFLVQFLDGDPEKMQYRWWLSLRESHARFKISEVQRAAWLGLMNETIEALTADPDVRVQLQEFFRVASAYLLGMDEGEIEEPELKQRWSQQQILDRVVTEIVGGHEVEAIELASQFASRTSVYVGILARMMEAGRPSLVEFVLDSLRRDPGLAKHRFNGRTLLHFAAAYSILPVVRHLLDLGVDPNTLDNGGHSVLYRAAVAGVRTSGEFEDAGPAVIHELVRAGAVVDLAGGVNRSTALHEAARFGNVGTARALLEAGASAQAQDRKGLTPLDRARNCRRPEVVALMESWSKR
jgi:truncated hemoglobin YjbI